MIKYLFPYYLHHLKRWQGRDGVDQHITVDADKVLGVEYTIFILSSRVDNLGRKVLALVPDSLTKCILNGWVVAVDKMSINKLHRERGFA